METIDLSKLTKEQIDVLKAQVVAEQRAKEAARDKEIAIYKELVKKTVTEQIVALQDVSSTLSLAKAQIFGSFATIVAMKQELFSTKSGQQSHTFSDESGNSITIGYRVIDRFDDTLDMGIALVNEYLNSLAVDDRTGSLIKKINNLLKKDAKGNLRPNRVLDLQNMADEEDDERLRKGVEIIRASYKPVRSAIFIEAEVVDATGKKQSIGLSITSVDFPEGFEPNLDVFK